MEGSAIFEIFEGLPRQGPGSNESTERAFRLIPSVPPGARILDIGCGVGMQTIHLAELCRTCNIIAVDIYQPYLDVLMENATKKGVADRITTVCTSMDDLHFDQEEFDIIWAEGSIFVIGFEKGLEYWKQFLKNDGYMALTEAAWFTDSPSDEVVHFWDLCYPDIKSIPDTEKVIRAAGYNVIDRFRLHASEWENDFYLPLEKRLDSIGGNLKGNSEGESIIEFTRKEIAIFRKHPDEYGYVFFVMQKNTDK